MASLQGCRAWACSKKRRRKLDSTINHRDVIIFEYGAWFASSFAGGVLAVAGAIKLLGGIDRFLEEVRAYALLPLRLAGSVAYVIPPVEVVVGIFLFVGAGLPLVAVFAASLYLIFAMAISVNLLRGRGDISCGCFGGMSGRITWSSVARTVALAGMGALGASLEPSSERAVRLISPVVAAIALASVVLFRQRRSRQTLRPRHLPGPQPGDPVPIELRYLLTDARAGEQRALVVLWLSSGCEACRRLVAEFGADLSWRLALGTSSLRLLAVVTGDLVKKLPEGIFDDVVPVRDEAAMTSFGIDVLPFALSIDAQDIVTQTKVPLSVTELREWLESADSAN